ncbi:MAG: hypothetical protein ACQEQA_04360 [Bacillota bacterium]
MKLTRLESALFFSLTLLSVLMAANIIAEMSGVDFSLLEQFIYIVFYFLALFVPLYMFIQWMKYSTKERFAKIVLALIPALLFAMAAMFLSTELGYTLANF